jgi:hypothetical protein
VAALVEPQSLWPRLPQDILADRFHPGAGGVDQDPRGDHLAFAPRIEDEPPLGGAFGRTQRVRVRMTAPRSAASTALSTTRRASSAKQSEYS